MHTKGGVRTETSISHSILCALHTSSFYSVGSFQIHVALQNALDSCSSSQSSESDVTTVREIQRRQKTGFEL